MSTRFHVGHHEIGLDPEYRVECIGDDAAAILAWIEADMSGVAETVEDTTAFDELFARLAEATSAADLVGEHVADAYVFFVRPVTDCACPCDCAERGEACDGEHSREATDNETTTKETQRMQYEDITPGMDVRITATNGIGTVLHKRPAPEGVPADAVFVYHNSKGAREWISAADLQNRNLTPGLPHLLKIDDGTEHNEHDRVFWYLGREYRVYSMWDDGTGGCIVEHVAEDGTRTVMMRDQRNHMDAMHATVTAITAMRAIDGGDDAPVEYLVEAADRNVFPLRATEHPEADEDGRLHVASPDEVPAKVEGIVRATARDFITGKETRRKVYQWGMYPVYADGSLGQPTLYRA